MIVFASLVMVIFHKNQVIWVKPSQSIGLSTEFLESVNVYTQTDRAIKYGIVIIIITFACFFLFEVLKSLRIHPIQYSLVAMAQVVFFVLLLSISEYYAFAWAYCVAGIACVGLMSWYLYYVMKGFKAAGPIQPHPKFTLCRDVHAVAIFRQNLSDRALSFHLFYLL